MQFVVFSQDQVEKYAYEQPHVNISIRTPGTPKSELSVRAVGRKAVLFLDFHDCDDITLNGVCISGFIGKEANTVRCITSEQAQQILAFFNEWKDKVELVVVNCAAGISRSSATAAALAVVNSQDDAFIFNDRRYHPNMLVYRTILNEAFGNGKENSKSS